MGVNLPVPGFCSRGEDSGCLAREAFHDRQGTLETLPGGRVDTLVGTRELQYRESKRACQMFKCRIWDTYRLMYSLPGIASPAHPENRGLLRVRVLSSDWYSQNGFRRRFQLGW